MGLLDGGVLTATGDTLDATLDWWESSERRSAARARLASAAAIDPDHVIMAPDAARRAGLASTMVFPLGNLAPDGSVVKATAIDQSKVDANGIYRHVGPARVFADERDAIEAVKGTTARPVREGDVIVLIGTGPSGTGMQETAQITTALRYLPWGKHVALVTDGRFSGFSSGACIGHVGPEALDDGPIGRVQDDDLIEIVIDRRTLTGTVNMVGAQGVTLDPEACRALLRSRPRHPDLAPHERLPGDSRLWAALQRASGGTWAGCVYDVDRIVAALDAAATAERERKGASTPDSRLDSRHRERGDFGAIDP
jgi:dihydroxyacid dehydratase/phosphogluconate dehydratase